MNIILASQSPRRDELLKLLNLNHIIIPSTEEEVLLPNLTPEEQVMHIAYIKAKSVLNTHKEDLVIGADTIVLIDDIILGKPKDEQDAIKMLKMLSGKTHKVITAVAILTKDFEITFYEETEVTFYPITEKEIKEYIAKENVYDKAGSYAIQGIAQIFVKEVKGNYNNIVGLPLSKVYNALKEFKI